MYLSINFNKIKHAIFAAFKKKIWNINYFLFTFFYFLSNTLFIFNFIGTKWKLDIINIIEDDKIILFIKKK